MKFEIELELPNSVEKVSFDMPDTALDNIMLDDEGYLGCSCVDDFKDISNEEKIALYQDYFDVIDVTSEGRIDLLLTIPNNMISFLMNAEYMGVSMYELLIGTLKKLDSESVIQSITTYDLIFRMIESERLNHENEYTIKGVEKKLLSYEEFIEGIQNGEIPLCEGCSPYIHSFLKHYEVYLETVELQLASQYGYEIKIVKKEN